MEVSRLFCAFSHSRGPRAPLYDASAGCLPGLTFVIHLSG
jgi:hypothetical protein